MKLLVILSSVSQYREFRKRYNTSNVRIFCDNPQFESFLKKEGVVYERLDEFLLKSKWKKINRWGASKASEWGKIYSDVYPRNINLASATFLFFSYILVQMVKIMSLPATCCERKGLTGFLSLTRRKRGFSRTFRISF